MIWSISWKNVWRNKTRSMVVIVAVALGLFSGVFSGAIIVGWVQQRVNSAINNEVSHVQMHHPDYFANKEIQYTIKNVEEIQQFADSNKIINKMTARTKVLAMANTPGTSGSALMLYGIDPVKEKQVTDIYKKMQKNGGEYLSPESSKIPEILISEKTAKRLKLVRYKLTESSFASLKEAGVSEELVNEIAHFEDKTFRKESDFLAAIEDTLGSELNQKQEFFLLQSGIEYKLRAKIVVNFQGYQNGLVQSAFRVTGVYKTENGMFDEMSAFVLKSDLDRLAGLDPGSAHEIAFLCDDLDDATIAKDQLAAKFPELSVMEWSEIQPELKLFTDYLGIYFYILTIFILLALGFGIVNTMLMAILERIKELGMLMAVGMNKLKVFSMIMLESVFLTLTGGVVGIVVSTIFVMILNNVGLDLRAFYGEGFEAIGYSALIYPDINIEYLTGTTVLVILTGIIAAIYPARKAIKLNPADAIRTDN